MKPAVLTINKQYTPSLKNTKNIYPFNFQDIPQDAFQFINRNVVDEKKEVNKKYFKIGKEFPQILAYVTIKCGDEYLTYSRAKGAEVRLHGSLSLGFGGHVDFQDALLLAKNSVKPVEEITYQDVIIQAARRELYEELNYNSNNSKYNIDSIIVDKTNDVGKVHVGLPLLVELSSKEDISPDLSEIANPVWQTKEKLIEEIELYENWSQLIINNL